MCAYPIKKFYGTPKYNLSARSAKPKNIVVHYTDGTGSAENNVRYFRTGNRSASADFFIDSQDIWRFNPNVAKYYSWHIGIEVVSAGVPFTKAEQKRLRYLVKLLMRKYDIPASHVVRHYDASRKLCPAPYCGSKAKDAEWKKLHKYITK